MNVLIGKGALRQRAQNIIVIRKLCKPMMFCMIISSTVPRLAADTSETAEGASILTDMIYIADGGPMRPDPDPVGSHPHTQ